MDTCIKSFWIKLGKKYHLISPTCRLIKLILIFSFLTWLVGACTNNSGGEKRKIKLRDHPDYTSYKFSDENNIIEFGYQPLWIPANVICEVMRRDSTFHKVLEEQGLRIRFHPFYKGSDVNNFMQQGKIDAGVGGDMPALFAIVNSDVSVVAIIQHGFSSIVAKEHYQIQDLRGRRIGIAYGSNAHFYLLQALTDIGMSEEDVKLVPLNVDEMPMALTEGTIEAYSSRSLSS